MKVILQAKVPNLGTLGEQVKVKDGYARNYLLPKGLATMATKDNVAKFEEQKTELQQEKKPMERTYLSVPFPEKNEAKKLGAKWDKGNKSWYVRIYTPKSTKPYKFTIRRKEFEFGDEIYRDNKEDLGVIELKEEFLNFLEKGRTTFREERISKKLRHS